VEMGGTRYEILTKFDLMSTIATMAEHVR